MLQFREEEFKVSIPLYHRGLLRYLGYIQNVGYKKGWYRMIYKENFRNLTKEELETKCLGVMFCGTDEQQIIQESLKEIKELGI